MWFLTGLDRIAGLRIWLRPGETLTVGRQIAGKLNKRLPHSSIGDILSLGIGDISVGRRHIAITAGTPTMQSVRARGEHTKLIIRDLSSKYGVFLDEKRIDSAKDIEIEIKDENLWVNQNKKHVAGQGYGGFVTISIGEKTSFRLEKIDWSLCSQGLTAAAKVGIISTATEIEEAWTPGISTHLIVGKFKRSEKLSLALADGGYLVSVDWLAEAEKSFKSSWESKGQIAARTLETEFSASIPDTFESSNIQWTPNPVRKSLFKDYRFISVASVKYKGLSQVIQCSGGNWTKIDSASAIKLISECMAATVVPVFLYPHGEDNVAKTYSKIDAVLNKMGYRWVHEDEIGMAILYSSTDMYCNPKYLEKLPKLEDMGSLQSSQFISTQYPDELSIDPSIAAPSTISRNASTIGSNNKEESLVGDDTVLESASFGLSQLMMPSKRSMQKASSAVTSPKINEQPTPKNVKPTSVEKPAKKKTKTDRMAMFFDGLDDDEDPVMLDPVEPKKSRSTSPDVIPCSIPIPTSSLSKTSTQNSRSESKGFPNSPDSFSKKASNIEDKLIESDGVFKKPVDKMNSKITAKTDSISKSSDDKDDEQPSQQISGSLSASFSNPKSKKKVDKVQEDMEALKLEIKVGRQKDNMDDAERKIKMEAQIQENKLKKTTEKLMQSVWSESLVNNSKRRKVGEVGEVGEALSQSQESGSIDVKSEADDEVQILSEADQKDWPERWKNRTNFKIIDLTNPTYNTKWKNKPNFKAFRRATKAGLPSKCREPVSLSLDGEVKIEGQSIKTEQHVKQESRDAMPPPRRKVGPAQMAKNDLLSLLGDD
ncbi:hypothetical protein BGZ76_007954 [Entomortierella beljakovae]|nr:hypothetical protein BGZ76_007954 [Entomortierella beljakovae]